MFTFKSLLAAECRAWTEPTPRRNWHIEKDPESRYHKTYECMFEVKWCKANYMADYNPSTGLFYLKIPMIYCTFPLP